MKKDLVMGTANSGTGDHGKVPLSGLCSERWYRVSLLKIGLVSDLSGTKSGIRCGLVASGRRFPAMMGGLVFLALSVIAYPADAVQDTEASVVFALESEPERLDPLTIRNPQTFRVAWQIYEGLVGLSHDGEIEPRVAASWETVDYRTWTFTLQPEAMFHASPLFGEDSPSRKVTADDIVWSYTAFCSPSAYASFVLIDSIKGCAQYNVGDASSVEGLRAIIPGKVEITLNEPEPFFLNRISTAWIAIFPQESALPQFKEHWGLRHVVGTGPYQLVTRSDTEYVLEPNPGYWNQSHVPQVKSLVFRVIKNPQIRLAEITRGKVDISPLPPELFPAMINKGGQLKDRYQKILALKRFDSFNVHFIGIDINLVPDVHLRRAMSLGTDRSAIAKQLLGDFAVLIAGPIPSSMPGATAVSAESTYQPDQARAELALSGYNGEPIEVNVHDVAQSERIGQIFQQQMKEIGVNVSLVKRDYGTVLGRVINGEAPLFQTYFELVFSSPEPMLINLFSSAKIPVPNFWKYSNTEVDADLENLRGIASVETRITESTRIEHEIMRDVPAIYLYSAEHVIVHSRRVDDVIVSPHGHYQLEYLRVN